MWRRDFIKTLSGLFSWLFGLSRDPVPTTYTGEFDIPFRVLVRRVWWSVEV